MRAPRRDAHGGDGMSGEGESELEVVKVQAADPFMAVEALDAEEAERAGTEVARKRIYEVNGVPAHSADSIDACLNARELEESLGIEIETPTYTLMKDIDPEDDKTWKWVAFVRGANYNIVTGVRAGWQVGQGDAPYYMTHKDGSMSIDPFGWRKAIRIATKKVKMICLGDRRLKEWMVKTQKMIRSYSPPPRQESQSPAPAPPARVANSGSGGSTAGAGDAQDGGAGIPISEWGEAGDGKTIPTLKQMQYLTAPARGDRRMTEEQVRQLTRRGAIEASDRIREEEKK